MSLFEKYLGTKSSDASEKEKVAAMEKTILQLEERASMRAKMRSMNLTDEEVDQYIAQDKANKERAIQRKAFEESEAARIKEKNDKFISEQHLRRDLILYVNEGGAGGMKRTPFKKGLAITCPYCKTDDAFPTFTEHLKLELIRMRNNGIMALGIFLTRGPNMTFQCKNPECQKSLHLTILGAPE